MKNKRYWCSRITPIIIISLVGISIFLLSNYLFPQSTFGENYLGNFLATILGVIVGIPISFWIGDKQQEQESFDHTKKILEIIRQELNYDLNQLNLQQEEINK